MRRITLGTATMNHAKLDGKEVFPDGSGPRLTEAEGLIREAAERGCDLLCLPELFADPTQGTHMRHYAEEFNGPVTSWLSDRSRTLCMALATSVTLKRGDQVTNTGVVYDKDGELAGRYDKVHLPPGECDVATPGNDFPVFDFEGVRIGMQICHDLEFPEGCRILALKGAALILWPNMWGGMPEAHDEVLMKARAMENRVCLISSAYVLLGNPNFRAPKIHGRSCIIDPAGVVLAEVGCRTGVAVATVELEDAGSHTAHPNSPLRQRRPKIYHDLVAGHADSLTPPARQEPSDARDARE